MRDGLQQVVSRGHHVAWGPGLQTSHAAWPIHTHRERTPNVDCRHRRDAGHWNAQTAAVARPVGTLDQTWGSVPLDRAAFPLGLPSRPLSSARLAGDDPRGFCDSAAKPTATLTAATLAATLATAALTAPTLAPAAQARHGGGVRGVASVLLTEHTRMCVTRELATFTGVWRRAMVR